MEQGNSNSNIANCGYAALNEGWIYYSNTADGGTLYKIKSDGSEKQKLSENKCWSINVAGKWVYYINSDDKDKIYRVRTDGSEDQLLHEDPMTEHLHVVDGMMYFTNGWSLYKLYKMPVSDEGSGEKQEICSDGCRCVNIEGCWAYYNNSDVNKLYRIKTDGTKRTKLSDRWAWWLNVEDGWIYFYDIDDGYALVKIRADGKEEQILPAKRVNFINVTDGWIYYSDTGCGNELYKMRADGTNRQKLNDEISSHINIIGDWIYYRKGHDDENLYKMRTDGTEKGCV